MKIRYFADPKLELAGRYRDSTRTIYINRFLPFYIKPITLLHESFHYLTARIEKNTHILDLVLDIFYAIVIRWNPSVVKEYLNFYSKLKGGE